MLAGPILDVLSLDAAVLCELEARYGREGLADVLAVLDEAECRERPAEARLAVLTLLERPTARSAGAYLRHLFAEALAGDMLRERAAEAARVRAAELVGCVAPTCTELVGGDVLVDLHEQRSDLLERLAAVECAGTDPDQAGRLRAAVRELELRLGPASTRTSDELLRRGPPSTGPPPPRTRISTGEDAELRAALDALAATIS